MTIIIRIVIAGVLGFVWMYILETIFGFNLRLLFDNSFLFLLLFGVPFSFITTGCLYFWDDDNSEEKAKPETNIDNPKESEVVVVTEIQGKRKIIKNGKVIYSEKLKADELKVFENLKDKN